MLICNIIKVLELRILHAKYNTDGPTFPDCTTKLIRNLVIFTSCENGPNMQRLGDYDPGLVKVKL